jgi:hypothetical protein
MTTSPVPDMWKFPYELALSAKDTKLKTALWKHAKKRMLHLRAIRDAGYQIFFQQELLSPGCSIIIDEENREVGIRDGHCVVTMFRWDSWDHDSVAELRKDFDESFVIAQPMKEWPRMRNLKKKEKQQ